MEAKKTNYFVNALKTIWDGIKQPVVATFLGLIVGAIVILIANISPDINVGILEVYAELFKGAFGSGYYIMASLTRATPIIFCAMATAFAWRAGYINIGVEGQMIVGALVATCIAVYMPGPGIVVILVSLLAGIVAGGLYALLAAWLNLNFGASLVIITLMMNYVANYFASYMVSFPIKDNTVAGITAQSMEIPADARLPRLVAGNTIHFGFILAILVTLFLLFIVKKTIFGYESKMSGLNPFFAIYGGVKRAKVMFLTMFLSGAVGALAGGVEVLGLKYRYIDNMLASGNYAWTGLQAALIANLNPVGMFFTSIFLAGLQQGGAALQRKVDLPLEISTIIQCSITLFVSVKFTWNLIKKKKMQKALAEGGNK